jgi:hypothetical protein
MLDVTRWDVIDCTPASFVPHFMEEAGVRQFGGAVLHQQILAVTTLFMIGKKESLKSGRAVCLFVLAATRSDSKKRIRARAVISAVISGHPLL